MAIIPLFGRIKQNNFAGCFVLYFYSNMGRHYIHEYLTPSDCYSNMGRHYIYEYLTPSDSEGLNLMNIMPTHI
jgi:hypothetical protein